MNYRRKKAKHVWVLQLADSVAKNKAQFFAFNTKWGDVQTANSPYEATWFFSKHHANSQLTNDMKHDGFIAREVVVLVK